MQRYEMIGRIGQELELKITQSNKKVIEFSMADTEKRNGEDITTWVSCVAWENKAETLSKYVKKGDMLFIEGKLRNQKYKAKDGSDRMRTFILVENFMLLPNKAKEDEKEENNKSWSREPNVSELGFEMKNLEFY